MAKTKRRGIPKGRRKLEFVREYDTTSEIDRILIVCEGEKTEPRYFKRLIAEYRVPTARVCVHGECGAAPISVFEFAEALLKRDDDFEHIFLVFDRDTHSTYNQAIVKTNGLKSKEEFKTKNIAAVTSVPCFEIWLLLHVSSITKPYGKGTGKKSPAQAVLQDLRKFPEFASYTKSRADFFEDIKAKTDLAVGRARKQIMQARAAGSHEHEEDSSTRIFLIVETLKNVSKA